MNFEDVVKRQNTQKKSWKAKLNPNFNYNDEASLRQLCRASVDMKDPQLGKVPPTPAGRRLAPLPANFDLRSVYKNCWSLFFIRDQGKCGGCWAINSAASMSDRYCISKSNATVTVQRSMSGEDILECCPYSVCGANSTQGCNGGTMSGAFAYVKTFGAVTGEDYQNYTTCKPWAFYPAGTAATDDSNSTNSTDNSTNSTDNSTNSTDNSTNSTNTTSTNETSNSSNTTETTNNSTNTTNASDTTNSTNTSGRRLQSLAISFNRASANSNANSNSAVAARSQSTLGASPISQAAPTSPVTAPVCTATCANTQLFKKSYASDKLKIKNYYSYSKTVSSIASVVTAVKNAIYTRGTVAALMTVYYDFFAYSSGVYVPNNDTVAGNHTIRLIGWGVDSNNSPYWIGLNSWNTTWGMNGSFWIYQGNNTANIELYITEAVY